MVGSEYCPIPIPHVPYPSRPNSNPTNLEKLSGYPGLKLTIPSLNHHYQTLFTNRKPCAVFSWNVHSIILTSVTFHRSTLLPSCDTPSPPTSTSSAYDVQISDILQDPDQYHLPQETSPDSHNSLQTPEALHLGMCLMSHGVGGYLCPRGLILSTRPHPCDPPEQAS